MNDQNPLPQYDRSALQSDINFYQSLFRLHDISREGVIPARVEKYNRTTGIARVRPIVNSVIDTVDGEKEIERPSYEVHVVRFAHGGFLLDAPLLVGDTGWLIASDRNCNTTIQKNSSIGTFGNESVSGNEFISSPDDSSISKFSNGFFIPASWGEIDDNGTSLVIKRIDEDGDGTSIVIGEESLIIDGELIKIKSGNSSISLSDKDIRLTNKSSSCIVSADAVSAFHDGASVEVKTNVIRASNRRGHFSITESSSSIGYGSDNLIINDDGIHYEGLHDSVTNLVTDIRYNLSKHCLEQRSVVAKRRGDMIVNVSGKTDWYTVEDSEAVPEYKG